MVTLIIIIIDQHVKINCSWEFFVKSLLNLNVSQS